MMEDIIECMKCGDCQAVCPTFSVTGDESSVARGRIRLVKALNDGEIGISDTFAERIDTCMMCSACAANCPSGVKVERIILSARERIAREKGLPLFKKVAFKAVKHPRVLQLGLRCASLFFKFKSPISKSFMEQVSISKVKNPKEKVVFFRGCMVNYIYPEIGLAAVEVLAENDIEVLIKNELCCGIPALYSGDRKTAKYLAEENIRNIGRNTVVTCCPSCETALKEYPVREIYDISEFLVKRGFKKGKKKIRKSVSYHDPCHLNYGLRIKQEPREIIKSIKGIKMKELKEGCCGFAGVFSLSYPEMSRGINDRRIDEIKAAGADIIATGCPGCKMHMEEGLKRRGIEGRVVHTVELLRESYKGES